MQENVKRRRRFCYSIHLFSSKRSSNGVAANNHTLKEDLQKYSAIMPYYGYGQDRKSGPRSPMSAKLVANLISTAGANRALMVDLHAGQIQGFFDIPTDNLFATSFIGDHKKN